MTDVRHTAGQQGEEYAAEHFLRLGWQILARNHRTRFGELDLVVFDPETLTLIFVEVKTRRSRNRDPWENLHHRKQSQVREMAIQYLKEVSDRPFCRNIRFDGVAVLLDSHGGLLDLNHMQGAF